MSESLVSSLLNMSSGEGLPYVIKRDGRKEKITLDKITARIYKLAIEGGLDTKNLKLIEVIKTVIDGVCEGIHTRDLDNIAAKTCAYKSTDHPDYGLLAARIEASNLQKETKGSFSETVADLYNYRNEKGEHKPVVTKAFYDDVMANKDVLDSAIAHERDYDWTYFGLKTVQGAYLLKCGDKVVERPQYMLMRVAVALHQRDLAGIMETYECMSKRYYIHASPTLFNAGTHRAGYASCFLASPADDSIEGMYDLIKELAVISKYSGGIGIQVHDIRAKGSKIHSSNGTSEGIVPYLRVLNNTMRHVTQSSRRPGSAAVYLEPTHPEILDFIALRQPNGSDEMRARDLWLALWIPDLFMEKVKKDEDWCLFCPDEAPGLSDVYGEEYNKLYYKYEAEGKYRRKIKARAIMDAAIHAQITTGVPYMAAKDAVNMKANQKHMGTIKSSNLCIEVLIRSDPEEIGVCILASIGLPSFVRKCPLTQKPMFDHDLLREKVHIITRNLNKVIDRTDYPLEKTRRSNERHRPIGIGVSGLADLFCLMRMPFDSREAQVLNREVFETIYYAACEESMNLAKRDGAYPTFQGSEFSKGNLQFDLWKPDQVKLSGRWDWDALKEKILVHGMHNSLLTAVMPTATTSQILGYSECIEPYSSNIYLRKVLSGEFQVVNQHLLRDLTSLGLWNERVKKQMIMDNGSIQKIRSIPQGLKEIYKTTWEIKQRVLIDLSADRGPFIDQTQSLNIFKENPTYEDMLSAHFYGWSKGLKTMMYYLKMAPAAEPIKFTVQGLEGSDDDEDELAEEVKMCRLDDPSCAACSG